MASISFTGTKYHEKSGITENRPMVSQLFVYLDFNDIHGEGSNLQYSYD